MTMTATQFNRNCQNFVSLLQKSQQFDGVKTLLNQWKQKNKPAIGAIDTFMKMAQLFKQDQDLVQQFNKCLVKEASIPKRPSTNLQIKQLALQNQKSGPLLDMVLNWIKNDEKQKAPQILLPPPNQPILPPKLQQLTQPQLLIRIQKNRFLNEISQILALYRKCIISLKQFKSLIQPIYLTDPSVFNMLFQYAQQLQIARRKMTIFAPLTDLVDQKYPVQQVGNSYIVIPDGYANYSHKWATNPLENLLNRYCCSVPLGSEGSFVIARKNEYEEALFKNQEQKYEIDQNICMLRLAIAKIQGKKNFNTPLLQKLLAKIYPIENVFNIMISHPQIANNIILPRLNQKLQQLIKCKITFKKQCQQVSLKNFSKSLDYRCFYFRKNDKKYNSILRWQKQIQLRKIQIIQNIQQKYHSQKKQYQDQINDRQALQSTRSYLVNTFNNITKQQILQQRKINLRQYEKKPHAQYPKYPDNQVLFIMGFDNDQVFNDVLQIILYHCQKKYIFQLIVLKVFKKIIKRTITKDSSILAYIDTKTQKNININNSNQLYENNQNSNYQQNNNNNQPLNQPRKDKKIYKDITEQYFDFIEEQIQSIKLEQISNPFQGPNQHTFIGTKTIYNIVRCLLTIYQRFLKAKQLSDSLKNQTLSCKKQSTFEQTNQITLYQQFLAILIFKVKDTKQLFEEYLRKIMNQQTFIYFTLDKFIINLVKLINNINNDSLTYKIIKDQIKDYQIGVKKWEQYQFQSITKQLTKLHAESQALFRFTFTSTYLMYISTWENTHTLSAMSQKDKEKTQNKKQNVNLQKQSNVEQIMFDYMTQNNQNIKNKIGLPQRHQNHLKNNKNKKQSVQQKYQILKKQNAQYINLNEGIFLMKGQQVFFKYKKLSTNFKRSKQDHQYTKQFDRLKKFIKKI